MRFAGFAGFAVGVVALASLPAAAAAQTLQGRVLDAQDGRPVPQTLVRLLDASGQQQSLTLSDLQGRYVLTAPAPGRYVLAAERIGFEDYRSREVEMPRAGATYEVDLLVVPEPIPIRGLEVTAERRQAIDRRLRLLLGMAPASIRNAPVLRPVIEDHLARGHDVTDLVRWLQLPSVTVRESRDGPCFLFRQRSCLPVYLDGVRVRTEMVPLLPLEMAETVVVLQPNESVQFSGGGILLYTAGWLGVGR